MQIETGKLMEKKTKLKILLTEPIHETGTKLLSDKGYEVRTSPNISEAILATEVKDAVGILVRMAQVPANVIEAGRALKVIARHGVGYDNVDVTAATRRGIPVCITPRANAVSVAEHTLALMLALAKRIVPYDSAIRNKGWGVRNSYSAVDLDGKVLGVVGMGRTGTYVCSKAAVAFNMKVLVYSPTTPSGTIESEGGRKVSELSELLSSADFISLHVPLKPETTRMIGAQQLRLMKPSAFLINMARGPVVDEAALVEALENGTIAGAGLDVFDPEPPRADNPLFKLSNVVLSPHSAGLTIDGVIRMATQAAQAIVDVLEGRRPEGMVNPEVWPG